MSFELDENFLRLLIFVVSIFLFISISYFFPFRNQKQVSKKRLFSNISLGIINTLFLKLLIPLSLVQFAGLCDESGWGLFNNISSINSEGILIIGLSVLLLDVLIYWQHRITHIVPILWRLHRVHHSDTEFDTTSGVRFHPVEIIISYILKAGFIFAMGLPAISIIIFEIILSTSSLFNHSNFSIPNRLEKYFRYFIVTPTMHRIHHSTIIKETNSNYSFSLSIWDRIFLSYTGKASSPQQTMKIGLDEFRGEKDQGLSKLILQPFLKDKF